MLMNRAASNNAHTVFSSAHPFRLPVANAPHEEVDHHRALAQHRDHLRRRSGGASRRVVQGNIWRFTRRVDTGKASWVRRVWCGVAGNDDIAVRQEPGGGVTIHPHTLHAAYLVDIYIGLGP